MDLDLKPNSLKISLLLLFILLFFLYVKPVYGDGGFVPTPNYREMHKYVSLPEQKSIIVWDGENEKMVLSSKVKAEDISNFAWILPIQSSIKPRVERGI